MPRIIRSPRILLTCLLACGWLTAGCVGSRTKVERAEPAPITSRDNSIGDYQRRREEAQMAAARVQWEKGDAEGALLVIDHWREHPPTDAAARRFLADVLVANQQPAKAEAILRRQVAENPSDAEAHHALGKLLKAANRPDAQRHLREAARLDPDNGAFELIGRQQTELPAAPLPTAL